MIGSLPPAVTFCEMFADLIPVLVDTFWDTENYTVKNTHVCWLVYVKLIVMSETTHVMPSGSCEVDMTLLLERQMKNI